MESNTKIRYLITLLNFAIGWHLLFEGTIKISTPWSSADYLAGATGPFASLFHKLAESPLLLQVTDIVNIYGLTLIGFLLIIGLLVRYAAIGGSVLLFMYYISNPPFIATGVGYGVEGHYLIVNKNLIESITLLVISLLPSNLYYGIQNLNLKRIFSTGKVKPLMHENNILPPGGDVYHRREVLKNLAWLPFLGSFFYSWNKTKLIGINAITGETLLDDAYYTDDMTQAVHPPNEPIGIAQGIFPGRVSWVYNPLATNPDCTNTTTLTGIHDENDDAWYMDKNNNQEAIDKLVEAAVLSISGKKDIRKAWDAIFRYHNKKLGKGNTPYKEGEKFFLKSNRTSFGYGWHPGFVRIDRIETLCCESSPHFNLAVLRQLVYNAGVPQNMIYIGDPMKEHFYDEYHKYHAEFPDVHYLSNSTNDLGRTKVKESSRDLIFYSDKGNIMKQALSDKLYNVIEDAEYIISLAAMKAHDAAGISLCTKNHFGTQARQNALHLHQGLNSRRREAGYGQYRVMVDIMGNKHTGGKNLFYILDALWTGGNWNGLPEKFLMHPFNNKYFSSVLASFDPVAIESVAFDFLRSEFTNPKYNLPHMHRADIDDYLHQAADSKNWPEGIVYAPDGDGIPLPDSLGVHEHWNNPEKKEYTRNLGKGKGIELVKIFQTPKG